MSETTTETRTGTLRAVVQEVTVPADVQRAFEVYLHGYSDWELTEHHLADTEPEAIVLEPFAGGRWYERHADGTECEWGSVLEVDPPHRLVLAWHVGIVGDRWGYDPEHGSRVTVTFTPVGERQ